MTTPAQSWVVLGGPPDGTTPALEAAGKAREEPHAGSGDGAASGGGESGDGAASGGGKFGDGAASGGGARVVRGNPGDQPLETAAMDGSGPAVMDVCGGVSAMMGAVAGGDDAVLAMGASVSLGSAAAATAPASGDGTRASGSPDTAMPSGGPTHVGASRDGCGKNSAQARLSLRRSRVPGTVGVASGRAVPATSVVAPVSAINTDLPATSTVGTATSTVTPVPVTSTVAPVPTKGKQGTSKREGGHVGSGVATGKKPPAAAAVPVPADTDAVLPMDAGLTPSVVAASDSGEVVAMGVGGEAIFVDKGVTTGGPGGREDPVLVDEGEAMAPRSVANAIGDDQGTRRRQSKPLPGKSTATYPGRVEPGVSMAVPVDVDALPEELGVGGDGEGGMGGEKKSRGRGATQGGPVVASAAQGGASAAKGVPQGECAKGSVAKKQTTLLGLMKAPAGDGGEDHVASTPALACARPLHPLFLPRKKAPVAVVAGGRNGKDASMNPATATATPPTAAGGGSDAGGVKMEGDVCKKKRKSAEGAGAAAQGEAQGAPLKGVEGEGRRGRKKRREGADAGAVAVADEGTVEASDDGTASKKKMGRKGGKEGGKGMEEEMREEAAGKGKERSKGKGKGKEVGKGSGDGNGAVSGAGGRIGAAAKSGPAAGEASGPPGVVLNGEDAAELRAQLQALQQCQLREEIRRAQEETRRLNAGKRTHHFFEADASRRAQAQAQVTAATMTAAGGVFTGQDGMRGLGGGGVAAHGGGGFPLLPGMASGGVGGATRLGRPCHVRQLPKDDETEAAKSEPDADLQGCTEAGQEQQPSLQAGSGAGREGQQGSVPASSGGDVFPGSIPLECAVQCGNVWPTPKGWTIPEAPDSWSRVIASRWSHALASQPPYIAAPTGSDGSCIPAQGGASSSDVTLCWRGDEVSPGAGLGRMFPVTRAEPGRGREGVYACLHHGTMWDNLPPGVEVAALYQAMSSGAMAAEQHALLGTWDHAGVASEATSTDTNPFGRQVLSDRKERGAGGQCRPPSDLLPWSALVERVLGDLAGYAVALAARPDDSAPTIVGGQMPAGNSMLSAICDDACRAQDSRGASNCASEGSLDGGAAATALVREERVFLDGMHDSQGVPACLMSHTDPLHPAQHRGEDYPVAAAACAQERGITAATAGGEKESVSAPLLERTPALGPPAQGACSGLAGVLTWGAGGMADAQRGRWESERSRLREKFGPQLQSQEWPPLPSTPLSMGDLKPGDSSGSPVHITDESPVIVLDDDDDSPVKKFKDDDSPVGARGGPANAHGCQPQHAHGSNSVASSSSAGSNSANAMWTERCRPTRAGDVCGNEVPAGELTSWLQAWRARIVEELSRGVAASGCGPGAAVSPPPKKKAPKKRGMGRGRKAGKGGRGRRGDSSEGTSEEEEDYFSSDSDFESSDGEGSMDSGGGWGGKRGGHGVDASVSPSLPMAVLLVGPTGCGKTTCVYTCAAQQGFAVLEINSLEARSGAALRTKFAEATASQSIRNARLVAMNRSGGEDAGGAGVSMQAGGGAGLPMGDSSHPASVPVAPNPCVKEDQKTLPTSKGSAAAAGMPANGPEKKRKAEGGPATAGAGPREMLSTEVPGAVATGAVCADAVGGGGREVSVGGKKRGRPPLAQGKKGAPLVDKAKGNKFAEVVNAGDEGVPLMDTGNKGAPVVTLDDDEDGGTPRGVMPSRAHEAAGGRCGALGVASASPSIPAVAPAALASHKALGKAPGTLPSSNGGCQQGGGPGGPGHSQGGGMGPGGLGAGESASQPQPQVVEVGVNLILFEDVDVVFEDEKGFLTAVTSLLETTKRPVVLTSRFVPPWLRSLPGTEVRVLELARPPTRALVELCALACLKQGGVAACPGCLYGLARAARGDIRHMLLTLQFWMQGGWRSGVTGGGRLKSQVQKGVERAVQGAHARLALGEGKRVMPCKGQMPVVGMGQMQVEDREAGAGREGKEQVVGVSVSKTSPPTVGKKRGRPSGKEKEMERKGKEKEKEKDEEAPHGGTQVLTSPSTNEGAFSPGTVPSAMSPSTTQSPSSHPAPGSADTSKAVAASSISAGPPAAGERAMSRQDAAVRGSWHAWAGALPGPVAAFELMPTVAGCLASQAGGMAPPVGGMTSHGKLFHGSGIVASCRMGAMEDGGSVGGSQEVRDMEKGVKGGGRCGARDSGASLAAAVLAVATEITTAAEAEAERARVAAISRQLAREERARARARRAREEREREEWRAAGLALSEGAQEGGGVEKDGGGDGNDDNKAAPVTTGRKPGGKGGGKRRKKMVKLGNKGRGGGPGGDGGGGEGDELACGGAGAEGADASSVPMVVDLEDEEYGGGRDAGAVDMERDGDGGDLKPEGGGIEEGMEEGGGGAAGGGETGGARLRKGVEMGDAILSGSPMGRCHPRCMATPVSDSSTGNSPVDSLTNPHPVDASLTGPVGSARPAHTVDAVSSPPPEGVGSPSASHPLADGPSFSDEMADDMDDAGPDACVRHFISDEDDDEENVKGTDAPTTQTTPRIHTLKTSGMSTQKEEEEGVGTVSIDASSDARALVTPPSSQAPLAATNLTLGVMSSEGDGAAACGADVAVDGEGDVTVADAHAHATAPTSAHAGASGAVELPAGDSQTAPAESGNARAEAAAKPEVAIVEATSVVEAGETEAETEAGAMEACPMESGNTSTDAGVTDTPPLPPDHQATDRDGDTATWTQSSLPCDGDDDDEPAMAEEEEPPSPGVVLPCLRWDEHAVARVRARVPGAPAPRGVPADLGVTAAVGACTVDGDHSGAGAGASTPRTSVAACRMDAADLRDASVTVDASAGPSPWAIADASIDTSCGPSAPRPSCGSSPLCTCCGAKTPHPSFAASHPCPSCNASRPCPSGFGGADPTAAVPPMRACMGSGATRDGEGNDAVDGEGAACAERDPAGGRQGTGFGMEDGRVLAVQPDAPLDGALLDSAVGDDVLVHGALVHDTLVDAALVNEAVDMDRAAAMADGLSCADVLEASASWRRVTPSGPSPAPFRSPFVLPTGVRPSVDQLVAGNRSVWGMDDRDEHEDGSGDNDDDDDRYRWMGAGPEGDGPGPASFTFSSLDAGLGGCLDSTDVTISIARLMAQSVVLGRAFDTRANNGMIASGGAFGHGRQGRGLGKLKWSPSQSLVGGCRLEDEGGPIGEGGLGPSLPKEKPTTIATTATTTATAVLCAWSRLAGTCDTSSCGQMVARASRAYCSARSLQGVAFLGPSCYGPVALSPSCHGVGGCMRKALEAQRWASELVAQVFAPSGVAPGALLPAGLCDSPSVAELLGHLSQMVRLDAHKEAAFLSAAREKAELQQQQQKQKQQLQQQKEQQKQDLVAGSGVGIGEGTTGQRQGGGSAGLLPEVELGFARRRSARNASKQAAVEPSAGGAHRSAAFQSYLVAATGAPQELLMRMVTDRRWGF
eukprot:jgi/Mesvir1/22200/Mv18796-RA.1